MIKYFISQFSEQIFRERLSKYDNLSLSICLDHRPKQEDLSQRNIIILQEPEIYFSHGHWVLQNSNLFDLILTHNDFLINRLPNVSLMPFGATWFLPEHYATRYRKEFKVAHLCGKLLLTYGHSIRHEILNRQEEILDKIPRKFYNVFGDRYDIPNARLGKLEVFGDCQYGICIENSSSNGYFTEKILDCFLLRTVPIYWGCSNIEKFFNPDGIISISNADEAIRKINLLNENYYATLVEDGIIEENYQLALKYVSYENNICDKIEKWIKENGL